MAAADGPICVSTNLGSTWTTNVAPAQSWQTIVSSADGNRLAAAVWNGGIWTSQITPSPSLSIASTNGLQLSWLIPSTNFVLQQSSDLTSWSEVTNAPALNLTNLQNQVALPLSAGNRFFRLKTP